MIFKTKWKTFPPETLQLLFLAVEEDDKVDDNVSLPRRIDIPSSSEDIYNYYSLCYQFWAEGCDRTELLRLVYYLLKRRNLSAVEVKQYKYIRARYKHLRFALRLYTKKHDANILFRQTTVYLGHFQDAFKNHKNILFYGGLLRIFLSSPVWLIVSNALRHAQLDRESGFITYLNGQLHALKELIARPALTGREFHRVRKIIGQLASYYDTVRSLDPANKEVYQISRYLANINGLMGDQHDVMVADKLSGRKKYNDPALLDANIRQYIELLLARYAI